MQTMNKQRILVIEDSHSLSESLIDMLHFKGYETLRANNGTDGIALALNEHPDLILLDVRLPDIEGFSILRTLRENDWGKTARVLILTAADTSEEVPEDLNISESDILHKSHWGIENLATRIAEELQK